jgi:F-type H+-transporting ATPase subunit delta
MLKGAVARRYAEAVFDLGVQQGTLDRWQSDLHLIAEAFSNRKLSFILRQPRIPFARKEAIVRDLLEKRVTQEALGLALLLVERELVEAGPKVSEVFDQHLNDYHNQATAIVTSAVPLQAAQQAEVKAYLQALTGKNISLETKVDPDILGGIIARVGDTLIDGSVRRRLAIMRDQIARGGPGGPNDGATLAALGNGSSPGGTQPGQSPAKGNQPKR